MHDPVCFVRTLIDLVQEVLAVLIALSLLLDGLLKLRVLGGSGPLLDDGDWLEQIGPDRQHVGIEQQDVEHAVNQLQSQGSPVDSRLDVIHIVELWPQSHRQFILPHLQREQQLRFRELIDKDILKGGTENSSPAVRVRLSASRRDQLVHLFESRLEECMDLSANPPEMNLLQHEPSCPQTVVGIEFRQCWERRL